MKDGAPNGSAITLVALYALISAAIRAGHFTITTIATHLAQDFDLIVFAVHYVFVSGLCFFVWHIFGPAKLDFLPMHFKSITIVAEQGLEMASR
jgi:hypothetical protein